MNDNESAVSVVICVYTEERWDDIVAAVASVREQTVAAAEIVVVVDHNVALQRRVEGEIAGVRVVANGGGQGLSGGRNSGVAASVAPLVAFLDDDATAAPDWLARLTHCCDDPNVLGAGGNVEPAWDGLCPPWFPPEFYWVVGCSYRGMPDRITPVRNLFGGCMVLRKEVFARVGGFREGIGRVGTRPVGDEDTELCIRAGQQWPGRVLLHDPAARIFHRVPEKRATLQYLRARCYAEGLSKALVSRYVGTRDSLSTEWAYSLFTLPRGVGHGIADTVVRRDPHGLARAGTIVMGFTWAVAGYLVGRLSPRAVAGPPPTKEPHFAK